MRSADEGVDDVHEDWSMLLAMMMQECVRLFKIIYGRDLEGVGGMHHGASMVTTTLTSWWPQHSSPPKGIPQWQNK